MAEKNGIYKCDICGNVVSMIEAQGGELFCCGQAMSLLEAKPAEQEGKEKHIPVISEEDGKISVNVGSIDHPMESDHYIEIIELLKDGNVILTQRLNPGDKPKAIFCTTGTGYTARIYCNLHGLWQS